VHELFRWRLVFPYWKGGRVVYFIARRTDYTPDDPWEQAKYKKLLTHSDKHRYVSKAIGNDFFYNEDDALVVLGESLEIRKILRASGSSLVGE